MYLIDEEDRLLARSREPGPSRINGCADLLDPGGDCGDLDENPVRLSGHDGGDSGLSRAWRTPENQGHRLVGLDQSAQRRSGGEQVLLSDQLLQRAWPHPDGERGSVMRTGRERSRTSGGGGRVYFEESIHGIP